MRRMSVSDAGQSQQKPMTMVPQTVTSVPFTGTSSTSSFRLGCRAPTGPRRAGAQGREGRHFIPQRPLLCFSSPARPHYDVIMFDVDSKDPTLGMSCPPPAFVDQPFLQRVRRILTPEGVFILNLVCRDPGLKEAVLGGLKAVFPLLYVRRIEGEVNEILFCQLRPERPLATLELLEKARALEQALRKPGRGWDDTCVLSDMLQTVQLV
ncbi:eEF1A lysine and N-terminal methyltransferase [Phyllostomus discolor]|uniref:EEF1A lysine and N-terminal methyltransferase n=1 Tax=Phyllostomus discolor TaxID=89673 RepID=A0A833YHC6_9CHIR|nr:eEF1A lysine and N-terminal methyltransferase [Phyllostomus discolor]